MSSSCQAATSAGVSSTRQGRSVTSSATDLAGDTVEHTVEEGRRALTAVDRCQFDRFAQNDTGGMSGLDRNSHAAIRASTRSIIGIRSTRQLVR